jgi:hypothetical protein
MGDPVGAAGFVEVTTQNEFTINAQRVATQ